MLIFTARKRSCGKVMFLHLSISYSVHGGGGSLYDVTSLSDRDTPLGRHPPEQTTPHPETATAADGTYPTGMHSC